MVMSDRKSRPEKDDTPAPNPVALETISAMLLTAD
jgi:hypothetical protein